MTGRAPDDDPRFRAVLAYVEAEWPNIDPDADFLMLAAKAFRTAYMVGYMTALRRAAAGA